MKKSVLINVLLLCVCILLHAQIDCEDYVKKVDSLIREDNLSISERDRPDINCEESLLNYVHGKGYMGDSDLTIFEINDILLYISRKGSVQATREHAINGLLSQNYHFDVDGNYRFRKEDFHEQALLRLKDFLQKRYSPPARRSVFHPSSDNYGIFRFDERKFCG